MRILILCTGNSCRSQMAEGYLKHYKSDWEVFSAGTAPAENVHPFAIQVMKEDGIDISRGRPKHVDRFISEPFDYVITVCDHAKETCPVFVGNVKEQIHMGFEDPAGARGTGEEILGVFRKVRDLIKTGFGTFIETVS